MIQKTFPLLSFLLLLSGPQVTSAANLRILTSDTEEPQPTPSSAPTTSFQGYLVETLDSLLKATHELQTQNYKLQSQVSKVGNDVETLKSETYECFTGVSTEVIAACGDRCCSGNRACTGWGPYVQTVCAGSCIGEGTCSFHGAVNTVIHPNSCIGYYACYGLGGSGSDGTVVETGACVGDNTCDLGGHGGNASPHVHEGACRGNQACGSTNQYGSAAELAFDGLEIGTNSCSGYQACLDIATRVSQLKIGTDSCIGNNACKEYAHDTTSTSATSIAWIGDYACTGENACREKFRQLSVPLGSFLVDDRECQGANACYDQ